MLLVKAPAQRLEDDTTWRTSLSSAAMISKMDGPRRSGRAKWATVAR
jgi:hypothetical protein